MNTVRSGQALDKEAPGRLIVPAAGCLAAIIAGWFIVRYDNPLTATLIIVACAAFLVATLNPKAGFYLLILATGYVDLVKRLGLLAGNLTFGDVVVTLAVPPILCVFICIGVGLQFLVQPRRLERWQYIIFVVIALLMICVLLKEVSGGTGLLAGLQNFANSGSYFPLILISGILFPKPDDVKRLIRFCLIVYIPVALYAIWQQIVGLSDFELNYLHTGYTMTVGLLDDMPRPFSTLNSVHALAIMSSILALLAFFVHLKGSKDSLANPGWISLRSGLLLERGSCWLGALRFGSDRVDLFSPSSDNARILRTDHGFFDHADGECRSFARFPGIPSR